MVLGVRKARSKALKQAWTDEEELVVLAGEKRGLIKNLEEVVGKIFAYGKGYGM